MITNADFGRKFRENFIIFRIFVCAAINFPIFVPELVRQFATFWLLEALCFLVLENLRNFQAKSKTRGCITASRCLACCCYYILFYGYSQDLQVRCDMTQRTLLLFSLRNFESLNFKFLNLEILKLPHAEYAEYAEYAEILKSWNLEIRNLEILKSLNLKSLNL